MLELHLEQFNKKSPDTSPAAPTVTLPAFSPKLITPPVAPARPYIISPAIASISIRVGSSGNGPGNVIIGDGSNGRMQSVAVAEGDF